MVFFQLYEIKILLPDSFTHRKIVTYDFAFEQYSSNPLKSIDNCILKASANF